MDFVILVLVISAGGSLAWCTLTGFSAFRTASRLQGRAGYTKRRRRLEVQGPGTHSLEGDGARPAQRRSPLTHSVQADPVNQHDHNPVSLESHPDKKSGTEYGGGLQR